MADARRVLLGVVVGAHGVRGEVKLKSFAAEPRDVAAYGPLSDESGARLFSLRAVGMAGGAVVARIEGVADRDAAAALKGLRLYVAREALPPTGAKEWYQADLIGLAAVGADGRDWGTVAAFHDFGAGVSVELTGGAWGKPVVLPFTDAAVPEVDVAGGRITVDPPAGVLHEPGSRAARDAGADGAAAGDGGEERG